VPAHEVLCALGPKLIEIGDRYRLLDVHPELRARSTRAPSATSHRRGSRLGIRRAGRMSPSRVGEEQRQQPLSVLCAR
jgi:hypothetical protein